MFPVSLEMFVAEQLVDKPFFSPSTAVIQGQKQSQGVGVQPVLLSQTQSIVLSILWIANHTGFAKGC